MCQARKVLLATSASIFTGPLRVWGFGGGRSAVLGSGFGIHGPGFGLGFGFEGLRFQLENCSVGSAAGVRSRAK